MKNIKLTISYLGTPFLGWQKTKMGPSIEEALEKAIAQILREEVQLQAASRTDAGVHAEGQVVNFLTAREIPDLRKLQRSLNGVLPKEISVLAIEEMEADFHPTLDNCGKEYHYFICNGQVQLPFHRHISWHFPYPLDLTLMNLAAHELTGTHDFSAFCNENALSARDGVCTIDKVEVISLPDDRLRISVRGHNFLYKMVRNLVGTLVYVGCGKIALADIKSILTSGDRTKAGVTAPAHGLFLKEVLFPTTLVIKEREFHDIAQ